MTDACYLSDQAGQPLGSRIVLDGEEGRHASVVKRTKVGETIIVADGKGHAKKASVLDVRKGSILVELCEQMPTICSPYRWTVVQALAKGDRSDIAVESLTELGVDEIIAWQADRSVVKWQTKSDKGVEKWRKTARQSMKQSRRYTIPEITYATTSDLVERIRNCRYVLIAHESASRWIHEISLPNPGDEIMVIIGPEGGISDEEVEIFTRAGGIPVLLSDAILRTSSAGVIALAQLQSLARMRLEVSA